MKKQLTPTAEKPWFCFDGDQNEYFESEKEALEASKAAISYYLDEFWDEQVNSVMVGKITHLSSKANVRDRPDDECLDEELIDGSGEYWPDGCGWKCEYIALPLKSAGINSKPDEQEYYCQCNNKDCGNWYEVSKTGETCKECKKGTMQPQDVEPY